MGLYLVEVDIDVSTPEKRAAIMERIEQVVTNKGTPTAKLVAGPFGSLNRPTTRNQCRSAVPMSNVVGSRTNGAQ